MSQVMGIVKIIGAWGCIIGACVLLVLTRDTALAGVLGITSIAFSQAPV